MTEQVQPAAPSRRIDVLDYARFFAAVIVLAYHYTFNGISNGKIASLDTYWPIVAVTKYGYLGVDLFFLISGFVIANSARNRTAHEFAVGRAVRLYPAFWIGMLLTAGVTVLAGSASGLTVSLTQVVVNLTMVPDLLGVAPVDGVYWTLLAEIQFYALVFCVALLRQTHRIGTLAACWAIAMLVASVAVPIVAAQPLMGDYFPLFAAGAVIAEIRRVGARPLLLVGLVASAATSLPAAAERAEALSNARGVVVSGVVVVTLVALFYALLLSLCSSRVSAARLPSAQLLGGLTYPLYVVHAHIGYILLTQWATEANRLRVYPMVVALVLATAYVIHLLVEKRLAVFWRRLFGGMVGRPVALIERRTATLR